MTTTNEFCFCFYKCEYKTAFDAVIKEFCNYNSIEEALKLYEKAKKIRKENSEGNVFGLPLFSLFGYSYSYNINNESLKVKDIYFRSVFGELKIQQEPVKKLIHFKEKSLDFPDRSGRNGIEILGLTPNLTKDGKYCYYNGVKLRSIKDLKDACKKNGIKGYSKCDKTGLIKLLMKC